MESNKSLCENTTSKSRRMMKDDVLYNANADDDDSNTAFLLPLLQHPPQSLVACDHDPTCRSDFRQSRSETSHQSSDPFLLCNFDDDAERLG